MSSLVVESHQLEEFCEQFVIGVVDSKLLVASDLLPSYQPESQNYSKGYLRVLSRSTCGAEEFQVLTAIPFLSYSGCSLNSGNCHDFYSSKAVYTLDLSSHFIWAFAYGIYDKDQSPCLWMFRISTISGEYTCFEIGQLQTQNGWESCTSCRASKLQLVGQDSRVHFVLHDTNLFGWEKQNDWNDFYHHTDRFHSIEISVDLESKTFDLTCSEHIFPSKFDPFDCYIQSTNNSLTEWCWISNDTLVVYNTETRLSTTYIPNRRSAKRLRRSSSHKLKLVKQPKGLQLIMEPQFTPSSSNISFYIYKIAFCHSTKTFGLKKVQKSNAVPSSLISIDQQNMFPRSDVHVHQGLLYKFYGNYCLTMFLRKPTLQEAAFVGLQKMWMNEEKGVVLHGISPLQLNQKLDINAIWF